MKQVLNYLFEYKTLSRDMAKEILVNISKGVYNDSEMAAFMTVFLMRSITVDELAGFREALLDLCVSVSFNGADVLDIVGTGGDGKNTFNISTLSCFIAAGAGVQVAKHGNYGVSTVSGASNVMEFLGYKFSNDQGKLSRELEEANICFLHAPLFHPALKTVGPIRKQLGVRTFFNMLGPLVNPARPKHQVIGVYNLEMARVYSYIYQDTNAQFLILHSLDGYDEVSLTSDARIITNQGERNYTPEELGKRSVHPEDIYGGQTVEQAAKLFLKILKGQGTWAQHAVVIANAALSLYCHQGFRDYETCYQMAVESLESGRAFQTMEKLISLQS